jgi:hypothetical protein
LQARISHLSSEGRRVLQETVKNDPPVALLVLYTILATEYSMRFVAVVVARDNRPKLPVSNTTTNPRPNQRPNTRHVTCFLTLSYVSCTQPPSCLTNSCTPGELDIQPHGLEQSSGRLPAMSNYRRKHSIPDPLRSSHVLRRSL